MHTCICVLGTMGVTTAANDYENTLAAAPRARQRTTHHRRCHNTCSRGGVSRCGRARRLATFARAAADTRGAPFRPLPATPPRTTVLTGRRPAPPPTLVNVDPRSRQHSARHCALRARRSGMSRLRGQIRRNDDTSEDVQRLETAGNAVFSNRLKRATRFRSCLRLRPRRSTINYARAAT
jgi:hypothetical protein